MAKKEIQFDEDIIDLTELIESGDKGDGRKQPAPESTAGDDDDDFAAILAETTGSKVDPNEQLDMSSMGGIDNLLESLDIPPQPRENPPTGKSSGGEDLDSVLDDLLGNDTPKKAPEAKAEPPSTDDGLDDLLGDLDSPAPKPKTPEPADFDELADLAAEPAEAAAPKAAPNQKTQPTKAASNPLDEDLDDLLASFDEPATPKTAPEPAPKPAAADEPSIAADLDDILGEVELPKPPPAPEPPVQQTPQKKPEPPVEEFSLLEEPDVPEEIDAMLDEQAPVALEPEMDIEDIPEAAQDKPEKKATASTEPALIQNQIQPWSPEALVGICRNLASIQDEGTRQTLQEFSRELGEQTAHTEDMSSEITQMGKRLLACESKLSAARARIASLEKGMESTAALGDLLKDGSQLHAGFMALISTAVSNALKGFTLPDHSDSEIKSQIATLSASMEATKEKIAALENRLDAMEQAAGMEEELGKLIANVDNSDAAIKALEKKLAAMDQRFGAEMEKAAAATVARVLHEEISRLAQE